MNRDQYHYKKLAKRIGPGYPPAVYYSEKKQRYTRIYRSRNSKYYKQLSNRKIRRYQGELAKNGNNYHRLFDFWWSLY